MLMLRVARRVVASAGAAHHSLHDKSHAQLSLAARSLHTGSNTVGGPTSSSSGLILPPTKTKAKAATNTSAQGEKELLVDRSGLVEYISPRRGDGASAEHKETPTALGVDLRNLISVKGPISIHDFMTQAANNSLQGYYQHKTSQLGGQGDFITAPEVSQLFGEMVAIWLVSAWQAMGKPESISLVEAGPGSGALMRDILRVSKRFPSFRRALRVHLVELGALRTVQLRNLTGEVATDATSVTHADCDGVSVTWHSFFREVPLDRPMLVVAQEFLDVFPIHRFAKGSRGWTEVLVDVDDTAESPLHFRLCLAPTPTPAMHLTLQQRNLPSSVYSYLSHSIDDTKCTSIEVSPLALSTVQEISAAIVRVGGTGLFIDYGEPFTAADTLRGFSKHTLVNALSEPGMVDVTADVDFFACSHVARLSGAHCALQTQGEFLMRMGVVDRLSRLIDLPTTSEDQAQQMFKSMKMLVAAEHMGEKFKVLCVSSESAFATGF